MSEIKSLIFANQKFVLPTQIGNELVGKHVSAVKRNVTYVAFDHFDSKNGEAGASGQIFSKSVPNGVVKSIYFGPWMWDHIMFTLGETQNNGVIYYDLASYLKMGGHRLLSHFWHAVTLIERG